MDRVWRIADRVARGAESYGVACDPVPEYEAASLLAAERLICPEDLLEPDVTSGRRHRARG